MYYFYKFIFEMRRLFWRVACNFIPFKEARIRIRREKFTKIDEKFKRQTSKIITISQIDGYLPSRVLRQINARSNAEFIALNRTSLLLNADIIANERERERETRLGLKIA